MKRAFTEEESSGPNPKRRKRSENESEEVREYILSEEEKNIQKQFDQWKEKICKEGEDVRLRVFAQKFLQLDSKLKQLTLPEIPKVEMRHSTNGDSLVDHISIDPNILKEADSLKQEILEAMHNVGVVRLAMRLSVPNASDAQTFRESVKLEILKELGGLGRYCGSTISGIENCVLSRSELLELIIKRGWNEDYVKSLQSLDEMYRIYTEQWIRDFKILHILIDDLIGKNMTITSRNQANPLRLSSSRTSLPSSTHNPRVQARRYLSNFI
jgi:hypothetical protein